MNTNQSGLTHVRQSFQKWRRILSPIFGITVLGIFSYWVWIYWNTIVSVFRQIGLSQLAGLLLLLALSSILTVFAFVMLVQSKGYKFNFWDGYYTLNYSQLTSMLPGGIWGFAGLASILWSKGISKADSLLVIFLNTLIMLTACAVVGITGLASTFGWGFAVISLLPFLLLLICRNKLDQLRAKYLPDSSQLPATAALIKVLLIGIAAWVISSSCFAWLFYTSAGFGVLPFWTVSGAYATAYLGGYLTLFAPSGLGVSEGLTTLILAPAVGAEKILSIAIAFRIVNTFIIWGNILIAVLTASQNHRQPPAT